MLRGHPPVGLACAPRLRLWKQVRREWELPNNQKEGHVAVTGYCVKCRKKGVEIQNATQVTMKNGKPAVQGTCPDCGTKIFRIGKME